MKKRGFFVKKIIVLGANGYMGEDLLSTLLISSQYQVLAVTHGPISQNWLNNIPRINLQIISTEDSNFNRKLKKFEPNIIINTACKYDRNGTDLVSVYQANLEFPLSILTLFLDQTCKEQIRFININTSLDRFVNAYALSKQQFCEWGKYLANLGKIQFINIALEHFYGINDQPTKFVSFLAEKMKKDEPIDLTDGLQKRDFIFIEDVIRALKFLCERPINEAYLDIALGSGEAVRVRDFVMQLKTSMNSESVLNFNAVPKRENEPEILEADMGWWVENEFTILYPWKLGLEKFAKGEREEIK